AARRRERAPIAISLGHHPLLSALGGLEIPARVSEYAYASVLTGRPYRVVRGPITGLPIPADSEVALEGFVSHDAVPEGPFGEFLGYYAGGTMQTPTIEVRAIYHRDDPILLGTAAGIPPYDYSYYRCPIRAAMLWNALERSGVPGVAGVWCHESGYSRALNVVAIRQAYRGHAQQVGFLASQLGESVFGGKYVIVVDDDIDPTDTNQVLWALTSRTDPATSIELIRHSWGMALDPMVVRGSGQELNELAMSRAVINACKPIERLQRGEFPASVVVPDELRERLLARWGDLLDGS
ncbi:MAG: UbiD family decarboxylase, partial [bacterium]|nr:UbiD family decarboxylase [bacterium]